MLERLDGGDLGQPIDIEGLTHLVQRHPEFGGAQAVADAQPAQPVDLGEGAQHDDVLVGGLELQSVLAVGRRHELVVGLVDHDQHVTGDGLDQPCDLGHRDVGTGRVVGVAHDDHLGARRDRGDHRLEIVREIDQRYGHRRRLVQGADVPEDDERRIGEHDLVALLQQCVSEEHEELAGAVADRHLRGVTIEVGGQRRAQVGGVTVWVPVEFVEPADDRLFDLVEGRQRELVGGQLDDVAQPELAHHELDRPTGHVGDDALDRGDETHGLLREVET